MSATWITRRGLGRLLEQRPELRLSVCPMVSPAHPEQVTLYAWHLTGEEARLHGYYTVQSHLAREVLLVLVEAQIREAGRHFDVAAFERARLARLRGPVAA